MWGAAAALSLYNQTSPGLVNYMHCVTAPETKVHCLYRCSICLLSQWQCKPVQIREMITVTIARLEISCHCINTAKPELHNGQTESVCNMYRFQITAQRPSQARLLPRTSCLTMPLSDYWKSFHSAFHITYHFPINIKVLHQLYTGCRWQENKLAVQTLWTSKQYTHPPS